MAIIVCACSSVGPGLIRRDQPDYSTAIHEASKQQLFLNLLRLRYGELPSVMTISQVIAGYEMRGRLQAGSNFFSNDFKFSDDFSFVTEGVFTDRPTITLQPLRGLDYARSFLRPIPPNELLALILTNAHVETAFALGVQRVNGIANEVFGELPSGREPDGRFGELIRLVAGLRRASLIQVEFVGDQVGRSAYISFDRREGEEPDPRVVRFIELLGIDPEAEKYRVRFGATRNSESEIVVLTRSFIDILSQVAATIDVPQEHVQNGRTVATRKRVPGANIDVRFDVEDSQLPLIATFVTARYAGQRFLIAENDYDSKRLFSMLMLFSTLLDPNTSGSQPLITVPTG